MHELAALLVLTLGAGAAHPRPTWLEESQIQAVARAALPSDPLARPAAAGELGPPPPCAGDFCQPQVALPGYTPRFTARTARAQLAARTLDRIGLEPAASVAWWLASSGLRFEYTAPAADAAANGGTQGLGYYQLVLAHRIDAFGGLATPQRGR